ncbi:MAG: amidohydrolase family protein, partial [Acidimicrobiia bacterium]|nr:amidohydrolase family protein [Acidimicrobiia bacterium]
MLAGGEVVDEVGRRRADVLVTDGQITAVGERLDAGRGALRLDASDALVIPGLVDLHTHLRQPGLEEAETVESGARAAALGGYTAVVAMPNTDPPIDSAAVVREVLELGVKAICEVRP